MRATATLLVAVLSCGIVHADPFATRRPPTTTAPAAPTVEPAERIDLTKPACDCAEEARTSRLRTARLLGGAAFVMGAATLALSLYESDRYHDAIEAGDIDTANDASNVMRYGATGMTAAAMLAAGASIYFYVSTPDTETPRPMVGVASRF